jgi:lysophospholipase L1-like esterase
MRKLLLSTLMSLLFGFCISSPLKYVDASTLTFINKAQPTANPYYRVEVDNYPDLSSGVRRFYTYPTGIAVVFRTDSRTIGAHWTLANSKPGTHVPVLSQKGLDLYIKRDGKWVFAGIGRPERDVAEHTATIVEHMDGEEHECLLYLPLFDAVKSLEIGIDSTAHIAPIDNPFQHRIIVIGSSITHGTGVSRPGMAYPARLERATGFQFINLGTSGLCKMEQFTAKVAAQCSADAFLFDCFSNPSAEQINERLVPFVQTIRAAHPNTPLIFLQTEIRESRNFNEKIRKFEDDKRAAAASAMKELMKNDRNIYFINPGMPLGTDHDATIDGIHPSDMGHERILTIIEPQIVKILKKNNIR